LTETTVSSGDGDRTSQPTSGALDHSTASEHHGGVVHSRVGLSLGFDVAALWSDLLPAIEHVQAGNAHILQSQESSVVGVVSQLGSDISHLDSYERKTTTGG
jgi:hypothetical protein